MNASEFLADLEQRGLLHDSTDKTALAEAMGTGPVGVYYGCDPTADSLHVGNLIGIVALRRFQLAGHRPIALAGGATGKIGDPSFRATERPLLSDEVLDSNVAGISGQLERYLDFEPGPTAATLVNNLDWTGPVSVIEFLRDVGKHVTVGTMLSKESVKARLASDHGISFTEFSYMLLQANDFWWLHENLSCDVQIGGSDQWGNITAGIDMVRRRSGAKAHGWTWPLLTRSDGSKFGKSADGENVWLSPERTSPYQFFQYWLQLPDADVGPMLRQLTLLELAEIEAVVADHEADPGARSGQRRVATELTTFIHGSELAEAAEAASDILFGGDPVEASADALALLEHEIPAVQLAALGSSAPGSSAPGSSAPGSSAPGSSTPDSPSPDGSGLPDAAQPRTVVDVLVESGLVSSRKEAKRSAQQGGVRLNGVPVQADVELGPEQLLHDRWALIQKGKRHHCLAFRGKPEPS